MAKSTPPAGNAGKAAAASIAPAATTGNPTSEPVTTNTTAADLAAANEAAADNASADQVIADQTAANEGAALDMAAKIFADELRSDLRTAAAGAGETVVTRETIMRVAKAFGEEAIGRLSHVGEFAEHTARRFNIDPNTIFAISRDGSVVITIDGRKLTVTA